MQKHFCVACFVYDKKGKKFLLVKHKKLGVWVQPGGHIEENEDPEEACKREVLEECGIKVNLLGERFMRSEDYILPLALQRNEINQEHIHIDFVYVAVPVDSTDVILNEQESDGISWFTIDEILNKRLETYDDVRKWCKYIIEKY